MTYESDRPMNGVFTDRQEAPAAAEVVSPRKKGIETVVPERLSPGKRP